jgi:hypothetical protein
MKMRLSKHAKMRIRQRCNTPKGREWAFVGDAVTNGIKLARADERLTKYIQSLIKQPGEEVVLFGEYALIIRENVLATVKWLPLDIKDYIVENYVRGRNGFVTRAEAAALAAAAREKGIRAYEEAQRRKSEN